MGLRAIAFGSPTGTGNFVKSASPTFTGTITAAALTLSGALTSSFTGINNLTGPLHIGTSSSAARAFRIAGVTLSGDNQLGALISPTFTSASVTTGTTMDLTLATAAAAFTMVNGYCLRLNTPSIGAASAITTGYALKIEDQTGPGTAYAIFTGTGLVQLGGAVSLTSTLGVTGLATFAQGTATTAGGALAAKFGSGGVTGIYFGSGAPTISAPQGSIYLRTDGSSTSTRLYVNTTGSTTWTNVTTAA